MSSAGAGRIGAYERCVFMAPGQGEFTPMPGAQPTVGGTGGSSHADELRIEMVCAHADVGAVVAAARSAHPYEEPLVAAESVSIVRGAARMGMLCRPAGGSSTLAAIAELVSSKLNVVPRVWGDPAAQVSTCVTATGSASSLIDDARTAGAAALVCGEVRYHDALDAAEAGLAIVEVGHDVSEWPLVEVLARAARNTPGLSAERVLVETPSAGWWTP